MGTPRASNVSTAPLCASYSVVEYYGDARMSGADTSPSLASYLGSAPTAPESGRCTTVSGLIVDEGASAGLWKLLTGDVQQAEYQGPHYPNSSTNVRLAPLLLLLLPPPPPPPKRHHELTSGSFAYHSLLVPRFAAGDFQQLCRALR